MPVSRDASPPTSGASGPRWQAPSQSRAISVVRRHVEKITLTPANYGGAPTIQTNRHRRILAFSRQFGKFYVYCGRLVASLTRLIKQQIIDEHFPPRRQQDVNFVGG